MWRLIAVLLAVNCVGSYSAEKECSCKKYPKLTGDCYIVHGTIRLGTEASVYRIYNEEMKIELGVDHQKFPLPENVLKLLTPYNVGVQGTFLVCPLYAKKKNGVSVVCIEEATGLVPIPQPPRI